MSHDPYAALRIPEYRSYLISMAAVYVAMQAQSAALGWQIYSITNDQLSLGLVGLAEALPFLALTLIGGWSADRFDRRALAIVSLSVVGISGAMLLFLSLISSRSIILFYVAQAIAGVARAFFRPTSAALSSELAGPKNYQNASTWRSLVFHVAMVLGPAIGGALIAVGGSRLAYGVVVGLTLIGLVAMGRIGLRSTYVPNSAAQNGNMLEQLSDGIRFVLSKPLLLGAMSLDMFAVLFGGATALLPVFARDILNIGEVGFGFLRAAPAVGAIAVSLALARIGQLKQTGKLLIISVCFFGITWIGFALSRSFILSLILLALGGAFDGISVVLRGTLVQTVTPLDKMGRVSAVNQLFIGSSNEIGAFESGVAARALGTVTSVVFGGMMTLATVILVAWRVPALRKLGRIEDLGSPEAASNSTSGQAA